MLKFQCLNNGFPFLEFKWNRLNNDDSLNMELLYDDDLHLIRKSNELLTKEIINFYYHSKYTVVYSKSSYRNITSFSFNYADFLPLSPKNSAINSLTLCNPWSFLVNLIFQLLLKSFLPSLFWNPTIISFH